MNKRIDSEKLIIQDMIRIYCNGKKHSDNKNTFCPKCINLLSYALERLDACPFADKKKFCSKCNVHCYEKNKRDEIMEVMRYSGPRIIFYHPITAIRHLMSK